MNSPSISFRKRRRKVAMVSWSGSTTEQAEKTIFGRAAFGEARAGANTFVQVCLLFAVAQVGCKGKRRPSQPNEHG